MSGYSCDKCAHRTCYVWGDKISDSDCEGIKKGHPCKPIWQWNAPIGIPDPRLVTTTKDDHL